MIQVLSENTLFKKFCQTNKKFGVFVSMGSSPTYEETEELKKAIKIKEIFDNKDYIQFLIDGCCYVICDTLEEADNCYQKIVGDDGPTTLNDYNGPCRVYACLIDNNGLAINENT